LLAYASVDGQEFSEFLALQRYNPAEAASAKYAFTFELCGKAFARVLVSAKFKVLDLADLYGHPWWDYKVCGYNMIHISRTDGRKLSSAELLRLERDVTADLRFDYSESELDVEFYGLSNGSGRTFLIAVQDHKDFEGDDGDHE